MQPNAFKTFSRLICCRSVYDEDDKDRFKVSNSVISSKTPSAYDSSANSRMSSGIRSIGSHSHFDRESQDLDSPFDTANPFLASLGHDDDWYEDEDVSEHFNCVQYFCEVVLALTFYMKISYFLF